MPLSRRKEVAEIVRRHEVLIFEDDAYGQQEPNAATQVSRAAIRRSARPAYIQR
jgi:DNA-binding transcriptional MocR family regulator